MSDMSDKVRQLPRPQLTVRADSQGVMPRFAWFAFCQQCEVKRPFRDYDQRDVWVSDHRRRFPDHRTLKGEGKL